MKKLLSKISVFVLSIITAFTFVSCGEKEIKKEEAYGAIEGAIEGVVTDLNQISITLSGSANVTKDETAESTSEKTVEAGTYTITASAAVITDNDRKVQSASLNLYLSDGSDKPLKLELYVKDGYNYSYTNLFGDSYSYKEYDDEPLVISEEDKGKLKDIIGQIKDNFPEPKAVQKDDMVTITWTITNENKKDYARAVAAINGETFNEEEVDKTLDAVNIENGEFVLVLKGGKITHLRVALKGSGEGVKVDANLSAEISYTGVSPVFSEERLTEIRTEATKNN